MIFLKKENHIIPNEIDRSVGQNNPCIKLVLQIIIISSE